MIHMQRSVIEFHAFLHTGSDWEIRSPGNSWFRILIFRPWSITCIRTEGYTVTNSLWIADRRASVNKESMVSYIHRLSCSLYLSSQFGSTLHCSFVFSRIRLSWFDWPQQSLHESELHLDRGVQVRRWQHFNSSVTRCHVKMVVWKLSVHIRFSQINVRANFEMRATYTFRFLRFSQADPVVFCAVY